MSGMVWDEVQRLGAALQAQALEMPDGGGVESLEWFRVVQAYQALERAIAEAWPPQAKSELGRLVEEAEAEGRAFREAAKRAQQQARFTPPKVGDMVVVKNPTGGDMRHAGRVEAVDLGRRRARVYARGAFRLWFDLDELNPDGPTPPSTTLPEGEW